MKENLVLTLGAFFQLLYGICLQTELQQGRTKYLRRLVGGQVGVPGGLHHI